MTADDGHRVVTHLKTALSSKAGVPVAWRTSIGVVLGMALGGAFGVVVDQSLGGGTVGLSVVSGMFLGVVAVAGPFFMALRLVAMVGLFVTLTTGLAVVAGDRPWLAVLGMVVLVFIGAVWTAIPLAGGMLGSFPTIVYLIVLAKGASVTGGATAPRAMLGAAAAIVAGLVVVVVMSGWDPRKVTRAAVAGAWSPTATWPQMGQTLALLRLDSAPRTLLALTHSAVLAMIARSWLKDETQSAPFRQATEAQQAVAQTLIPRGRLIPRPVAAAVPDAVAATEAAGQQATSHKTAYAWDRLSVALHAAAGLLDGSIRAKTVVISRDTLLRGLLRAIVHPDSAPFRYGVQRAVALGTATFIMVTFPANQFFWVPLTMFSVLQVNAIATLGRAVQYAFGTWIGAVGAMVLGLVLPAPVVSVAALILLAAGFSYLARNYFVFAIAVASAVVLLVGGPSGDFVGWAALRALDVTVGAVVAIAVSALVLRVRPQPQRHVAQAKQALTAAIAGLRRRNSQEPEDLQRILAPEHQFLRAMGNLKADLEMSRADPALTTVTGELSDANDQLLAMSTIVFQRTAQVDAKSPEGRLLIDNALDRLTDTVAAISLPPSP